MGGGAGYAFEDGMVCRDRGEAQLPVLTAWTSHRRATRREAGVIHGNQAET